MARFSNPFVWEELACNRRHSECPQTSEANRSQAESWKQRRERDQQPLSHCPSSPYPVFENVVWWALHISCRSSARPHGVTLRAIRRSPCPSKCSVPEPARGEGRPRARPHRKGLGVPACPQDALVFQTRKQGPGDAEGVACWLRNWGRQAMLTRGRNQEAEGTDSSGITGFPAYACFLPRMFTGFKSAGSVVARIQGWW